MKKEPLDKVVDFIDDHPRTFALPVLGGIVILAIFSVIPAFFKAITLEEYLEIWKETGQAAIKAVKTLIHGRWY